jgi:ABC-2 type transport system permease protein
MRARILAALWMETLKVRRTKVFTGTIYFFIFMGIVMGLLMFAIMNPEIAGRSSTIKMKTSFLGAASWKAYYELLIQLVLTIGVIGSGIITSWAFGREFSDGTVKDLLALPVTRTTIVYSKMVILLAWSLLLMMIVLASSLATGLAVRLPGWSAADLYPFLKTYLICAALNSLLITPVAFVASAGRGYILPIGFVILVMILTQFLFMGIPSFAFWFPWALPALYGRVAGTGFPSPGPVSYLIYAFTVLAGLFGTIAWWKYADHK